MVICVPDIESFIEQAREAGARVVYMVTNTQYRYGNSVPTYRAWVVATAVGEVNCHAGGPEKALLRCKRDFGGVPAELVPGNPRASWAMPEDYWERLRRYEDEVRAKLREAGFDLRDGEITEL
jgi:hypothetical protein